MANEAKTVTIEDARLIFRNFEGKEGQYNRQGDRNFAVILPPDIAAAMLEDGWNVKVLTSRDEEDPEETPYIQVSVKFDVRPPRIIMISGDTRTNLDEASCSVLDWAEFKTVDLSIRGYEWNVSGKSGIKAYLQTLYATIHEDPLDRKYSAAAADE